MAWFKKPVKKRDPLTPWEAYQAKQAASTPSKKRGLWLPKVAKTRQSRLQRNLALLLTPVVIAMGFFGYMVSPLAKVGAIDVRGETTVPAQFIISASKLDRHQVVLDMIAHRARIEQRIIKGVPQVQSVTLRVRQFNHVTLQVKEHPSLGYIQAGGAYHVLLANGHMLKTATPNPRSTYPIFTGFSRQEAVKLARDVAKFPPAVRRGVSEVKATRKAANPFQITILMADGNRVIADSRTVSQKIKYYPKLLADVSQKGTFDLEVGAFFKPAN